MNILTDRLPVSVEVGGVEVPIHTDFRVALSIIRAFEDPELTWFEKQSVMLRQLYETLPEDIPAALEAAVRFLNGWKEPDLEPDDGPRTYSFEKDAPYIYSAVYQTHGIDLETVEYMHWWKFCCLFFDLSEDCFFSRICYLRQKRNKGKLTKEEKAYCRSIRYILELPDITQPSEEESEFMRLLNGG